jgi:putative hydroxymethylpyrimidine transport system permease protein
MKKIVKNGILILVSLCLWKGMIIGFHLPPYLLPGPVEVITTVIQNHALLWREFLPTFAEAMVGFWLAVLWGVGMAFLFRLSGIARYWLLPIILMSQAIPTFAIAPFLVIWFGFGMMSKVAVTVFALFFPITLAFYDGLRRVPIHLMMLARVMRATTWQRLRWIEIPSALTGLASGLRMSAVWAPMAALIGEWVGSSQGLGFLILNANAQADTALMFSAIMVLVAFSLGLYALVDMGLKKWIFWEGQS